MKEQAVKDIEKEFLEPSFKYLVEHGLENTSVRDLCKEMKISYGSLYYWFEGKDDIYTSVIKYGTSKVVGELFRFAFAYSDDLDYFFGNFLEEVDKFKQEFRLICQFATSPVYGERMRFQAEDFKDGYNVFINRIADKFSFTPDEVAPVIYMLISILIDYVVWDDGEVSKMQLAFLHRTINQKIEKRQKEIATGQKEES